MILLLLYVDCLFWRLFGMKILLSRLVLSCSWDDDLRFRFSGIFSSSSSTESSLAAEDVGSDLESGLVRTEDRVLSFEDCGVRRVAAEPEDAGFVFDGKLDRVMSARFGWSSSLED